MKIFYDDDDYSSAQQYYYSLFRKGVWSLAIFQNNIKNLSR